MVKRAAQLATLSFIALASTSAWACPYCAAASGKGSLGVTIALGSFWLLPFVVVGLIIKLLRSERGQEQ